MGNLFHNGAVVVRRLAAGESNHGTPEGQHARDKQSDDSEVPQQEVSRPMPHMLDEASHSQALKARPRHRRTSTAIQVPIAAMSNQPGHSQALALAGVHSLPHISAPNPFHSPSTPFSQNRAPQTSSRAPSPEPPYDFLPDWWPSNGLRPLEIHQHFHYNLRLPASISGDIHTFTAHQSRLRSTVPFPLLHQAEVADPSADLAPTSPASSHRTVGTTCDVLHQRVKEESDSLQGSPSPRGLRRLSAGTHRSDSYIGKWMRPAGPLLPNEKRKAYKQSLFEEAISWNGIPIPVPREKRVRSLIRLDDTEDDHEDDDRQSLQSYDLNEVERDWVNYERHARQAYTRDSGQDFSVWGYPSFRNLDVLKVWVNLNLHKYKTWPPGYEPRFPDLDMNDVQSSVLSSETSLDEMSER